jgi:predicted transcriptional regulator
MPCVVKMPDESFSFPGGAGMSSPAVSELSSFREYLDNRIADGETELSPEQALSDRRELQESLASILRGLADADAGRIHPADEVVEELRARLLCR